jgi:hypothetical protein
MSGFTGVCACVRLIYPVLNPIPAKFGGHFGGICPNFGGNLRSDLLLEVLDDPAGCAVAVVGVLFEVEHEVDARLGLDGVVAAVP